MPTYGTTTRKYGDPHYPYGIYVAEPLSLVMLKTLFEANWSTWEGNIPQPTFTIVPPGYNQPDGSRQGRYDLLRGDRVILRIVPPGKTYEFVGFALDYIRERLNIELEVNTKESQQRLWNLFKELRRIIMANRKNPNVTGFHILKLSGFNELTQEQLNVYQGIMRISCENDGVVYQWQYA